MRRPCGPSCGVADRSNAPVTARRLPAPARQSSSVSHGPSSVPRPGTCMQERFRAQALIPVAPRPSVRSCHSATFPHGSTPAKSMRPARPTGAGCEPRGAPVQAASAPLDATPARNALVLRSAAASSVSSSRRRVPRSHRAAWRSQAAPRPRPLVARAWSSLHRALGLRRSARGSAPPGSRGGSRPRR